VTKCAGRPRLCIESPSQLLVVEPFMEQLDGDKAIDVRIAGEVDAAHAASTEAAHHVELVDPLNGWRNHGVTTMR